MLALTRKINQSILIGENIKIFVTRISKGQITLAIDAPKDIKIMRTELTLGDNKCLKKQ